MSEPREPWLAWPGWKHLRFAGVLALLGFAWFYLIFGGTDAITAHRESRVRVHLDAELSLPFVPDAILVYLSFELLIALVPFVLRERRPLLAFAVAMNTTTLLAGVCFLLLPAETAFPPPSNLGAFPALFLLADRMNLTYNLVPSLHVAFSVVCVAAFAPRASVLGRALLWVWAVAIAIATVLTHQHHILDVIAGVALGWFAFRKIYLPRTTARSVAIA